MALDDWISFDGRLVNTRAAIAAAAARDWDAAERHFATALATAEALGNRIEQVDLGFLAGPHAGRPRPMVVPLATRYLRGGWLRW